MVEGEKINTFHLSPKAISDLMSLMKFRFVNTGQVFICENACDTYTMYIKLSETFNRTGHKGIFFKFGAQVKYFLLLFLHCFVVVVIFFFLKKNNLAMDTSYF